MTVQGYFCPTHYSTGIDKELEFIDAQDSPLPTDFIVIRKRKDPQECDAPECHDQTRIFVTRGHYDGPDPDTTEDLDLKVTGMDKLQDVERHATSAEEQEADAAPKEDKTDVVEDGPKGPGT